MKSYLKYAEKVKAIIFFENTHLLKKWLSCLPVDITAKFL